jgi:gamma-glutamylcysteine synthetase
VSSTPNIINIKDFLRFYAKQSKGRINKHAFVEPTMSQVEFIFAGFTRVTRTQTIEEAGSAKIHDFAYRSGLGLVSVCISPDRSRIDPRQKSLAKLLPTHLKDNFYYNNRL